MTENGISFMMLKCPKIWILSVVICKIVNRQAPTPYDTTPYDIGKWEKSIPN